MPRKTSCGLGLLHTGWPGFNEAAARCRGKLSSGDDNIDLTDLLQ